MATFEVIVPCYKYGHFLRQCVESVLAQSVKDVVVTIVNDASPDDTALVADALAAQDSRVRVIHHAVNQGHIASYNEALAASTADFSLILSADDVLVSGALGRAISAFRTYPDAALCYGDDVPFQGEIPAIPAQPLQAGSDYLDYRQFLLRSCDLGHTPIQAPTAVMLGRAQRRIGGFLPSLPHSGDTEIWLRLAATGGVVRVAAQQAFRRLHAANMSYDYSLLRRLQEQRRAFKVHLVSGGVEDAARLLGIVETTIAKQAFWLSVRLFEDGDGDRAGEALQYAIALDPSIRRTKSYQRFRLRRLVGPRVSQALGQMGRAWSRARRVPGSQPEQSHAR